MPELAYMKLPASATPEIEKLKCLKKGGLKFTCDLKDEEKTAKTLVIYRFEDRRPGDYNSPENILQVIRLNGETKVEVVDETAAKGKIYTYVASTMNAQHSESLLSKWHAVQLGNWRIKKVR